MVTTLCDELFIPNAFSPNNDGHNDTLMARINPSCLEEFYFAVFDRWGVKIFETKDITKGWDGSSGQGGARIYYYFVSGVLSNNKEPIIQRGSVSIMK